MFYCWDCRVRVVGFSEHSTWAGLSRFTLLLQLLLLHPLVHRRQQLTVASFARQYCDSDERISFISRRITQLVVISWSQWIKSICMHIESAQAGTSLSGDCSVVFSPHVVDPPSPGIAVGNFNQSSTIPLVCGRVIVNWLKTPNFTLISPAFYLIL